MLRWGKSPVKNKFRVYLLAARNFLLSAYSSCSNKLTGSEMGFRLIWISIWALAMKRNRNGHRTLGLISWIFVSNIQCYGAAKTQLEYDWMYLISITSEILLEPETCSFVELIVNWAFACGFWKQWNNLFHGGWKGSINSTEWERSHYANGVGAVM